MDRHRALGGRTFPDQVDPGKGEEEKEREDGLPAFGKGLLKYWKFDPDCECYSFCLVRKRLTFVSRYQPQPR